MQEPHALPCGCVERERGGACWKGRVCKGMEGGEAGAACPALRVRKHKGRGEAGVHLALFSTQYAQYKQAAKAHRVSGLSTHTHMCTQGHSPCPHSG